MKQHQAQDQQQIEAAGGRGLTIPTPDGEMDCAVFAPAAEGPHPVVIIYMDAFGLREATYTIAQKLAAAGYFTLLPYLFYRSGPLPALEPATAFGDPETRKLLMGLIGGYGKEQGMSDTRSLLDWAATQPQADPTRVGTTGYCLGGGLALSAAASFPNQVRAAASYHGGFLVSDAPDSPHRQGAAIKAKVYIGAAEQDLSEEARAELRAAYDAAGVDYRLEFYGNAKHGFVMRDLPVYDAEADARHYETMLSLFAETLRPGA